MIAGAARNVVVGEPFQSLDSELYNIYRAGVISETTQANRWGCLRAIYTNFYNAILAPTCERVLLVLSWFFLTHTFQYLNILMRYRTRWILKDEEAFQ